MAEKKPGGDATNFEIPDIQFPVEPRSHLIPPGGGGGSTDAPLTDEQIEKFLKDPDKHMIPVDAHFQPELEKTFTAENVRKFLFGEITWGQLHAVSRDDAYAFANYAYAQYQAARYFDAEKVFQALVIIDPYDSYYHMMRGACLQMLDQKDRALDEYTASLQLDQYNLKARVNRAELFLQKQMFKEALQDLMIVSQLDPEARDEAGVRARSLAAATALALQSVAAVVKPGEPEKK